ncbi:MAG: BCCT family transporter [Spirochaetes bacterium]|nr:BCCT family transporter [Spirochaetota bacterium]
MERQAAKPKYDIIVIGVTAVFFAGIFVFSLIDQDAFNTTLNLVINFLTHNLGWFLNIATMMCILFCFYFMLSRFGKIRLGGKDAKPEFSTFTWWALSVMGGMGMGIVFFPPAEVIEYTFRPALGSGLEPGSYAALVWAMENTMMHWTLTLYGVYTIAGLMAAYVCHNMKQPFSTAATLYPLLGEKAYRYRSWIDGLVVFAIVGGVAGSFGYGILQVADGLNQLYGVPVNAAAYLLIGTGITLVYTISSITGLKKGIQWLGSNNAKLFIAMLAFVVIFGPTVFSLSLGTESTGSMITRFFTNMTFNEPMEGADKWSVWWNWLWYLDFFIFAPVVGFFLARLAKGRTIREFVTVNMVAPGAFCMIWVWFFGGLAAYSQFMGGLDLNAIMLERGVESVMLTLFDSLPLPMISQPVMIFLVMVSFITMANAVTSTVSKMSLKDDVESDGDSDDAPKGIQAYWGLMMGGVALIFLLAGGFDGARGVKLLVGFPVMFLQVIVMYGFVRMFMKKRYVEAVEIEGKEAVEEARLEDSKHGGDKK